MKKLVLPFYLSFFLFGATLFSLASYAEMNIPGANSVTYGEGMPVTTTTTNSAPTTPESSTNILNQGNEITDQDLRTGNVDMNSIPKIIISVINVLLGVAGTVAVVALIYYAVQMQINSGITGDSSGVDKAKKGMTGALIGFVVAILAWFIVIRFVEILSSVS